MIVFRKIILFVLMLCVTGALLMSVSRVQDNMETIITDHKLMDTNVITDASPLVAFTTIALGSFRGLLVDYLWLRASRQQEEGQFFELRQLASWITQLQPRFTGATSHLAWNMAYNVSVMFSYPDERWRWVKNGLELIRDEALVYNPADPKLYKELGWIYQHKIGNIMDDANYFYKRSLAREMEMVAGGADPDWESLAGIPYELSEFESQFLDGKSLATIIGKSENVSLNEFENSFRSGNLTAEKMGELFSDQQDIVEKYLRVRWMRDVLKLDPKVIFEINNKYGKLDWRLPESHAVYWATQGLAHSRNNRNIDCERMITQCLAVSFTGGRMISFEQEEGAPPVVLSLPNLSVADAVKREYEKAFERSGVNTFITARENFMVSAIIQFYVFGRYSKAQEYLDILKKEFPDNKKYHVKVDAFAKLEWLELVRNATPKEAGSMIAGQIYQSCMLISFGEVEAAQSFEKMAKLTHAFYTRQQQASLGRMGLMSYEQLKAQIIKNCLKSFPKKLSENLKFSLETMTNKVQ